MDTKNTIKNNEWTIKWENAKKTYPNGKEALKNINCEIKQGDFVAIIGLSGAGKTTLLKTVNYINTLSGGSLKVGPFQVNKLKGKGLRKFRQNIGIVFQRYNLIGNASVLDNVLTSRLPKMPWWRNILGVYSKEDKEIALKALAQVNILETAYAKTKDLSGGQMQRVALARTIAQESKIILADEPVGALDPIMAKAVMDDFLFVNKSQNKTVLANLHHVDLALQYADRVIGVKSGEIIFDGKATDVDLKTLKAIYGEELEEFDVNQFKEIKRKRKLVQDKIKKIIKERE